MTIVQTYKKEILACAHFEQVRPPEFTASQGDDIRYLIYLTESPGQRNYKSCCYLHALLHVSYRRICSIWQFFLHVPATHWNAFIRILCSLCDLRQLNFFGVVKKKFLQTHTYLLLAECEVRTASYGPSFFLPFMAQARSTQAMKTRKEGKGKGW